MTIYQLQREKLRDIILETAISSFKEKGYDNATIDEITKTVGIAKGTFYNFFSSKNEILLTWAERRFQTIPFIEACNPEKTAEENLYQFIDIITDAIKDEALLFRSLLKEIIRFPGDKKYSRQFDFVKLYRLILGRSSDSSTITVSMPEVKIDVLNHSLYMGILNWFDTNNSFDGLNGYLKNIIKVCMNGICNVRL
jgi:AcrR family transcriptional regulator